jgi:hypothetical protein
MRRNRSNRRALLLALATTLLGACDSGAGIFDCDKERVEVAKSDDGKHIATVLLVQCGASTRDATWVLVSQSGRETDDDDDRAAVFEGKDVSVKWVDGVLEISYGDATMFTGESSLNGVRIRYSGRK